jgi:hypothetical protein
MGMFDTVECFYPLPDTSPRELDDMNRNDDLSGGFQTKSLECTLASYTITKDGNLLREGVLYDYVGHIIFYTNGKMYKMVDSPYMDKGQYRKYSWYEYDAIIIHGKVESIVRIVEEKDKDV